MMNIELSLHVKDYNGGPRIKLYNNDKTLFDDNLQTAGPHKVRISTDMELPNKLVIQHYGKNMKRDTHIDHAGQIVDDKGFYIQSIRIDDVLLQNELYHFDFVKEDGEILKKNNYIGFNGKFIIDIDKDNIYAWQSSWQKMLVTNSEIFSYDKFREEIFSDG
tara:strand:+ start:151 stop:636 length:486 start_codon:yes stop_codon:yes gene_type:complete